MRKVCHSFMPGMPAVIKSSPANIYLLKVNNGNTIKWCGSVAMSLTSF